MAAWKRICCAIDFSERSRAAMHQAAGLATQLGAELVILHVRQAPAPSSAAGVPFAPPPTRASIDEREEPALDAWTAEAQRLAPGRVVTSLELSGQPAAEIVRLAEEFGCDAIVVGTHGRTGLARLALGSVAEAVVRAARCPVVVVRHEPAG